MRWHVSSGPHHRKKDSGNVAIYIKDKLATGLFNYNKRFDSDAMGSFTNYIVQFVTRVS